MKFVEKIKAKIKAIAKRGKALICTAAAAVSTAAIAVCASAETAEGAASSSSLDMATVLANAGESLMGSFNTLVTTLIPTILGILGGGIVIFGIMALIRLAKKTFGKVAG